MSDYVECKWCKDPTSMLETQECDRCHELRTRIEMDFEIAEKIYKVIKTTRDIQKVD